MSEFNEFNFTSLPMAEVPSRCQDCPEMRRFQAQTAVLGLVQKMTEATGSSMVGEQGEKFDAMIDADLPEEEAEELKHTIRKSLGESLEEIDKEIEDTHQDMEASTSSCAGPLKMRASKDGVQYTVTLCTSRRINLLNTDEPHLKPVYVKAETKPADSN